MDFVLNHDLLFMILMTLVSIMVGLTRFFEPLLDNDAPLEMVLWRMFWCFSQDVAHCMEVIAPLMMSLGSYDDLAYFLTPLDTSYTWDVATCTCEMGRCSISLMGRSEGRKPSPWTLHPFEDVRVWMDNIALDEDGTPLWRDYESLFHDDVIFGG
jgi:hypothetical protein